MADADCPWCSDPNRGCASDDGTSVYLACPVCRRLPEPIPFVGQLLAAVAIVASCTLCAISLL